MDTGKDENFVMNPSSSSDDAGKSSSTTLKADHGAVEITPVAGESLENEIEETDRGWFAYLKTRNFYIVLALGYVRCPQTTFLQALMNDRSA